MLGVGLQLGMQTVKKWWPDQADFAVDFTTNRAMSGGLPQTIGQQISATRASQKWAISASERWSAFSTNVPAITNKGCSMETSFTELGNFADASGAVAGVLGTDGALPTGWTQTAVANGVTVTVLDSGTAANKLPFVDLQFSGTPTADWSIGPSPIGHLTVGASTEYTASAWLPLIGGSIGTSDHFQLGVNWYNSGDSLISSAQNSLGGTLTTEAARFDLQAIAPGSSAKASIAFSSLSDGVPIDFSVRIQVPNMGAASFVTSPVVSQGTPNTRSADIMIGDLTWLPDTSEGLLVDEIMFGPSSGSGVEGWFQFSDGTNNNRLGIERNGTTDVFALHVRQSGSPAAYLGVGASLSDGNFHRVAIAWDSGQIRVCIDGGSIVTAVLSAPMASLNTLCFGTTYNGDRQPNGLIRQRIGYAGSGYSDGYLQEITS